jgi:hypothetical protein
LDDSIKWHVIGEHGRVDDCQQQLRWKLCFYSQRGGLYVYVERVGKVALSMQRGDQPWIFDWSGGEHGVA